jgi:PAS domain S-box-containing protein
LPHAEGAPASPPYDDRDSYRILLDAAPYGIYRSSLNGRFLDVNAALVRMLGYNSSEELLALDLAEELYVYPDDRARLVQAAAVRAERGPSRLQWTSAEATWRRKDGTALVVRLSGAPLYDASGALHGFQMIVEDRTEQRQLEQQLRQAQKMEAVGQLTSGIAHDFNNLLTVILTNAHLLREELPVERTDLMEDLDDVRTAAQRGVELIRKLSAFGRNEPLALRPLDLGEVVAETVRLLRRTLPSSISLESATGDVPMPIAGDPGAIEQILLNLATNARDAMPDGGVLGLALQHRRLAEEDRALHPWIEQGDFVCLTVSDNGHGMDQHTRLRIFEPFFTTKARGEGTGLGMAMVYGLVKQHAGYIHLYSEVGEGTVVRLFFPLARRDVRSDQEANGASAALPGGTETLLVVEDEPHLLAAARRLLTLRGYHVLAAPDGVRALEILREHGSRIALVLSDMVMPRMGGRQLHGVLRAEDNKVPMLFTSGYTNAVRGLAEEGARESVPFLQKPWTAEELLVVVRQALDAV